MYFQKVLQLKAFENDKTEMAKIRKVLTPGSLKSLKNAKEDKTGTYTATNTAKVGDIQIWKHTQSKKGSGHAGLVVKVNSDNTVDTIEGNTSDKSISDGDLVARKKRTSVVGTIIPGSDLKLMGFIRKTIK